MLEKFIIPTSAIIITGALGVLGYWSLAKSKEEGVCVKSKEISISDKNSKYLVFTNKEVFEITDTLIYGRFDSSDAYNKIDEGKCYDVELQGFRLPFLSMYRNIITTKESK